MSRITNKVHINLFCQKPTGEGIPLRMKFGQKSHLSGQGERQERRQDVTSQVRQNQKHLADLPQQIVQTIK